jgi:putative addiction module CopG family antidote
MKNIEISGVGEEVVDRLVASGRCKDASQAVDISLRLLDKYESQQSEKLRHLREEIREGFDDMQSGRVAPLDIESIIEDAQQEFDRSNPKS